MHTDILAQVLSVRSWDEKNNLTSFHRDHDKKEKTELIQSQPCNGDNYGDWGEIIIIIDAYC